MMNNNLSIIIRNFCDWAMDSEAEVRKSSKAIRVDCPKKNSSYYFEVVGTKATETEVAVSFHRYGRDGQYITGRKKIDLPTVEVNELFQCVHAH